MFGRSVETYVGMTESELDAAIRASESARREHAARHAGLLAVAQARGVHLADGHRSAAAFLRATCNTSDATIACDRKLARLLDAHPAVGDALIAGRISVDHALELGRVHANVRIAPLLPHILGVFLDDAEHTSHREFHDQIVEFITIADQHGAFDDLADAIDGRNAHVSDVGGSLAATDTGGDPTTTAQFVAVFESFVEGEYRADLQARRAEFDDDAELHPRRRTAAQHSYDAMIAMAAAAAASPQGRALPEPTVHIVIDQRSTREALTHAGITLPSGDAIELNDDGDFAGDAALLSGLADEIIADPESFRSRRCETSTGAKIHPTVALRSLLTGHVRRVVATPRASSSTTERSSGCLPVSPVKRRCCWRPRVFILVVTCRPVSARSITLTSGPRREARPTSGMQRSSAVPATGSNTESDGGPAATGSAAATPFAPMEDRVARRRTRPRPERRRIRRDHQGPTGRTDRQLSKRYCRGAVDTSVAAFSRR